MLARHSLMYALARGVPGALNFVALSVFTHLMRPEDYGRFALILAISGLLNSVLFEWLHLGLLRYLPTEAAARRPFLRTVVGGYLGVGALTGVLGGAALLVVPEELRVAVVLALALTWAQVWFDLSAELLRAQLRPLGFGVLSVARAAFSLGLGVVLVRAGLGASGRLLALLVACALPALVWCRGEWRGALGRPDPATLRQLLRYGLPLTVTFAFGFVLSTSDRLLLGAMRGEAAAGVFAVGMDLAQQSLMMLMAVVNLAAYPLAVRAMNERGGEAARAQLAHNGALLLAVAVPAATTLALLAPQFAGLLGPEYRAEAALLIPPIALSTLLLGFKAFHLDLSFQLGQATARQVWIVLIAAALNVGLNLLLIPPLGPQGCAYAAVAAALCAAALSWHWGRRTFAVPLRFPNLGAVAGGTLALCLALLLLLGFDGPLALAAQLAAGALAYGAVYVALSPEGRGQVRSVWGRARARRSARRGGELS